VSSVASVKRLGGRVLFFTASIRPLLKLGFLKIWGQYLGGSLILDSSVGFSRDLLAERSSTFHPACSTWFPEVDSGQ